MKFPRVPYEILRDNLTYCAFCLKFQISTSISCTQINGIIKLSCFPNCLTQPHQQSSQLNANPKPIKFNSIENKITNVPEEAVEWQLNQ